MVRFFADGEVLRGDTVVLTGENAQHAKVLRLKAGETVLVCDGQGTECLCEVTDAGEMKLNVLKRRESTSEAAVRVSVYMAFPKADKLEFIIQKAVELGVDEITPVITSRCIARPDPKDYAKKQARLQKIALEAAKQCGRGVLPDVALPLPNFGAVCRSLDQYDLVLFCYECGGAPLRQLLAEARPADGEKLKIAIITGAEGGFAAEEAEMAAKAGAKTVGLGPRILRCETAPLAVVSAVMTLTGNLE